MKKNITLAALFMLVALVFSSCEKKNEWSYYHGFTNEDVVGSYSWSNIDNAFDGLLESSNCHLCDGAKIVITKSTENLVRLRFENETPSLNVTVEDNSTQPGNDFMIKMSENPYEVSAYVYKNEKTQIRLHGFVRKTTAEYGPINYWFDVIKEN